MNKWYLIEEAYEDTYNKMLKGMTYKVIPYESFLKAILSDMCMVSIPRKMVTDESEFIEFAYRYFPVNSEAFAWARKCVGLKYLMFDKNEFIACYKAGGKPEDVVYITRAEAEYNPDYVQLVSLAVPYVDMRGWSAYMFVKESSSDMQGHTTMIGGHVQYKYNTNTHGIESLMIETALREAKEELGLTNCSNKGITFKTSSPYTRDDNCPIQSRVYVNPDDDLTSISRYHSGRTYAFEISKTLLDTIDAEPGKELVLWTPDSVYKANQCENYLNTNKAGHEVPWITKTEDILNPDPWLKEFIEMVNAY